MTEEYLIWCFEAKTFSRAIIKPPHCIDNFIRFDGGEISLLGEVLSNETIRVLVCGPLPG